MCCLDGMLSANNLLASVCLSPSPSLCSYSLAVYTAIAGDSVTLQGVTFTADVPAFETPDTLPASVVPRLTPSSYFLDHIASLPALLAGGGEGGAEAVVRASKAHAALSLPALATLSLWAPLPSDQLAGVVVPTVHKLLTALSQLVRGVLLWRHCCDVGTRSLCRS